MHVCVNCSFLNDSDMGLSFLIPFGAKLVLMFLRSYRHKTGKASLLHLQLILGHP